MDPRFPVGGWGWVLLAAGLVLSARAAPALQDASPETDSGRCRELTGLDRDVLAQLTAVAQHGKLRYHHRPGDLSSEQLAAAMAANGADFEALERALALDFPGHVHIFLYRDGPDLLARTEMGNDVAFSTGSASIHQVQEFRGPHELAHLFALQFARVEDGCEPDGFVVEGFATAMNATEDGLSVHDWAAVYLRAGRLPDLRALRWRWLEGVPPGVHPYLVAGSFVRYLVESHGIEEVKAWYVNSDEAHQAFGLGFARLERDWRAWLDRREVGREALEHVWNAMDLDNERLPEAWARAPGRALLAAGAPAGLVLEDPACWRAENGLLVGRHDGPWTALASQESFAADVGLRARLRLRSGDAVQLRLNATDEHRNEAILARWCTYMVGQSGASEEQHKIPLDVWCEVVFVNQGGRGRLYLNGLLVLEREGALFGGAGRVGLALERGVVELAELVAFDP